MSDPDFIETLEPLLHEKGLEKSDLQVNVKEEEIDSIVDLMGKNWYVFGQKMEVDHETLDAIKAESSYKLKDRKAKLLQLLIENDDVRYEDIVYGLYKRDCNQSIHQYSCIIAILNYLVIQRTQIIGIGLIFDVVFSFIYRKTNASC